MKKFEFAALMWQQRFSEIFRQKNLSFEQLFWVCLQVDPSEKRGELDTKIAIKRMISSEEATFDKWLAIARQVEIKSALWIAALKEMYKHARSCKQWTRLFGQALINSEIGRVALNRAFLAKYIEAYYNAPMHSIEKARAALMLTNPFWTRPG